MKKLSIVAVILLAILPSCRFIKVSDAGLKNLRESNHTDLSASETRSLLDTTVGEFNSLYCNISCDIIYMPGDCSVAISAPDNVMGFISIENEEGLLSFKFKENIRVTGKNHIDITVYSPELTGAKIDGAADFNAPNGIKASDFEVIVNGAGDVDINGLNTGKASVTVNGAGDIELSGVDCKEVILNINGAGDAKISGSADKCSATISGAGDIDASKLVCPDFRSMRRGVGSIKKPR